MDKISRLAGHAACACAFAAILTGCNNSGSSPMGFTPSAGNAQTGARSSSSVATSDVSAAGKAAFTHYYVVPLGTLGGTSSVANSINNRGWIAGLSKVTSGTSVHAILWVNGQKINLGTLGGPNSGVGWPVKNNRGVVAGISDLSQTDPFAENFCGFGTPNLCAGFRWKNNVMTALPTLGGNNSFAAGVNEEGRIVGFAENTVRDTTCGAPQVFHYYAAIWKGDARPRALRPLRGDAVSQAVSINNAGEAVGASGPCGPPNTLRYGTAHALLWPRDGSPLDLGSLGGTTANIATAINERGDVVGQSALTGNTTYHAFVWQHAAMRDLGTLPGDVLSEALGLNDKKQAVGYSCDAGGTCRGFIWQNGAMSDLNLLIPRSNLYVAYAGDINDSGWIVGQAVDLKTGRAPAVLLIPTTTPSNWAAALTSKVILPESVRRQLLERHGFRYFIK